MPKILELYYEIRDNGKKYFSGMDIVFCREDIMKRIKKISRFGLMCICILFFTVFWKPITANAQNEVEDLENDKPNQDGIVKIITAYADESGNIYYAKQGTGFVVGVTNNSSQNKKYVVSDYGNVQGEAVYLDAILCNRKYGGAV